MALRSAANRAREALGKLLLLVAGLLLVLAPLEFLVLPRMLEDPPLKRQHGFTSLMKILSQSSKRSLVPEDYVLLVGDSNATGYGDWLDGADPEGNPPYHSAHVIRDRLRRDVISFGHGGAGSLAGWALLPARRQRALRRYGVEAPDRLLAYFYEGNDLNNNLRYLRGHYDGKHDEGRLTDADYFDGFVRGEVADYVASKRLADASLTLPYLVRLVGALVDRISSGTEPPAEGLDVAAPGINQAWVGGERVELPKSLQSPALDLTPEELDRALFVADRSLAFLRELYPGVPGDVIYIPSPLSCYEIASEQVSIQDYEGRGSLYPAEALAARGARMRRELGDIARRRGLGFLDLTPVIREVGREQLAHGPGDWKHLNEVGYRAMGNAIADHIRSAAQALR